MRTLCVLVHQLHLRGNKNLGTDKGALYEKITAESLKKHCYELRYYRREDSRLEEDFFVRTASSLVPIEVKAAHNQAKSLKTLIQSDHYPDIH